MATKIRGCVRLSFFALLEQCARLFICGNRRLSAHASYLKVALPERMAASMGKVLTMAVIVAGITFDAICLRQVAKLAVRNTILAILGNPGPKINQKASKISKTQFPGGRRTAAGGELFFIGFACFLIVFWSRITQSR